MRLLVVDLLAEREGFGRAGVREIVHHFSPEEVYLWAPHVEKRLDYGYGTVVDHPVEADAVIITGSRRNVSMWEPWMDDVVDLIRSVEVPLYGICFGHQIIAHAFGGRIVRAPTDSHFVAEVQEENGRSVFASFAHQEHVVDAGERLQRNAVSCAFGQAAAEIVPVSAPGERRRARSPVRLDSSLLDVQKA